VTAGQVLTASYLNTYVRDNVSWLATDAPAVRAYNNANISITTSGVAQVVTLNSERYDNAAMHSTSSNTSRLTVPTGGGGKYLTGAGFQWGISGAGALRQGYIYQNGTTFVAYDTKQPSATHASETTITTSYALVAADYVELFVKQDSGGALNLTVAANYSPETWAVWYRT